MMSQIAARNNSGASSWTSRLQKVFDRHDPVNKVSNPPLRSTRYSKTIASRLSSIMETPKILQRCLRAAARTQVTRNATRRQQSWLQSTQTIRQLQSTRTTLTAGPPLRHFSSSIIARSEVAAEAKDTEKPAADAQDAAKPDPVAAELEAKKKEVVDLNVSIQTTKCYPKMNVY